MIKSVDVLKENDDRQIPRTTEHGSMYEGVNGVY